MNRLLARALDGVIVVGLTLYAAAIIVMAQRGLNVPTQPLLIWCFVVWVGPSLARMLIVPFGPGEASTNRFIAYSNARDGGRPRLWMLASRWLLVPAMLAGVLYHLNGRVDLASTLIQAIIVVVLFGAFFRATIELVSLIATAILPSKAAMVRRRAERTWNLVYFVGLPLLLLSRYHA